ncbi:hypothetical protein NF867_15785 [Solitalea sp. MAHUQ-68]|uniref:Lipoprotein n=1 Tax=Solitalea agri TaxID=2953739 RepID=A0A9X2JDN0_9SPHI|nr:hypothetical protein [Solitalea agri]MCO4294323.1 hypothetical protein [Solitalea agri]
MLKRLLLAVSILGLLSCNHNIKFEKIAWSTKDDVLPCACREQMLKDLTAHYKLVGLTTQELKNLLGEADFTDSNLVSYDIIIDYEHDIDPVYIKRLDFELSKDYTVKTYQIHEWKK